jgi:hypothetical protein
VNAHIFEVAVAATAGAPEWAFFCECEGPACRERVMLTPTAYEAIRDGSGVVLAPGHEMSPLARAARLAAEAQALRAPA